MSIIEMRKLINIINENNTPCSLSTDKQIISEIDRRGFLRGAGAAGLVSAGVGAASNANADITLPGRNYTYVIKPAYGGNYFKYYKKLPWIKVVTIEMFKLLSSGIQIGFEHLSTFEKYVDCENKTIYLDKSKNFETQDNGTMGEKLISVTCNIPYSYGYEDGDYPPEPILKALGMEDNRLSANSLITGAAGVGAAGAAVKGYQAYQNYKNKQN